MLPILHRLVAPKSSNEDSRRREFILNILLVSSVFLSTTSLFYVMYNRLAEGSLYQGTPVVFNVLILTVFFLLYLMSRAGFFIQASYLFIAIYFVPTTYTIYTFGADLPQGLLIYALIIVLSGILVSTKFSYFITFLVSLTLAELTYLQLYLGMQPKIYWKSKLFEVGDSVTTVITFFVIAVVSWLSNREMEAALRRARQSEADLTKERDSLEIRVEERTAELQKTQMEKMLQLYQFSEFGRLSAGRIHDLINPLTALSLNLDQASSEAQAKSADGVKSYVEQASLAAKRMEGYVKIARKQLQHQDVSDIFRPLEEIRQVNHMLEYKANAANVVLRVIGADAVEMFGNPIRFSQIMANTIANAIDAYEEHDDTSGKRRVDIRVKERESGDVVVSIQDWGAGIKEEDMQSIFDPFFTTKGSENGTGIGLFIVRQIVEKDFGGAVSMKSEPGFGTTCIIIFPKSYDESVEKEA